MFTKLNGNYKVVEINNVVALRSGAIIAQAPLYNNESGTYYKDKTVVQNGFILFLDIDGKLRAPKDAAVKLAPILHYTEELFTDRYTTLASFAVEFNQDHVAYPRGLVLTVGDTFTTNNVSGTIENGLFTINDNGEFIKAQPATYTGFLFRGIKTTLPDGETEALELTYLGDGGAA